MDSRSELNSSGQFHESLVMHPINFNAHRAPTKLHKGQPKSSILHKNYGDYQTYKLNKYLHGGLSQNDSGVHSFKSHSQGSIVYLATIDPDSLVVDRTNAFEDLLKKYTEYDICFVGVSGSKQSGKSFFCDKIYNLAEVNGNHYCQKHQPGLYAWSTPFIKDNLCIFFLEVAGCEVKSIAFRILTTMSLAICASYVYIHSPEGVSQGDEFREFTQAVEKTLKAYDFSLRPHRKGYENGQQQPPKQSSYTEFFPKTLYRISRKQNNLTNENCQFFSQQYNKYLPNAMNPSFKGNKSDLVLYSFLAKQYINPAYIKQVSQLFSLMYSQAKEKKYNDLTITGSIANRLINAIVIQLNSKKKIKIHKIYQDIVRDLYTSAYNLCVMKYHDELEDYFSDEKPKNVDEMYGVFERTATDCYQKFDEFNLNKQIHQEYQAKLEAHILSKQTLICAINKQKTKQELASRLDKIKFDSLDPEQGIKLLKEDRKELGDGRAEVIGDKLLLMMSGGMANNSQVQLLRQISKMREIVGQKKAVLARITKDKEAYNKLKSDGERQVKTYAQKLNQVQNKIKDTRQEIGKMIKRQNSIKDGTEKETLLREKQQLQKKLDEKEAAFKKSEAQDFGLSLAKTEEHHQTKIKSIKNRQAEIEDQLAQLKAEAAGATGGTGKMENPENKPSKSPAKASKKEDKKAEKKKA